MKYLYEYYTDIGGREKNEDDFYIGQSSKGILLAIADGLGGYEHGEMASSMVIEVLKTHFEDENEIFDLQTVIEIANARILKEQLEIGFKMKTTITVVWIKEKNTIIANIGDSRTYVLKESSIIFQTTDHSVAQMAVLVGEINLAQIRHHEDRSILTRTLGTFSNVKVDITMIENETYDSLILCSDGFWEYVLEEDMIYYKNISQNPKEWMNKMCKQLKQRQIENNDNYTAIVMMKKGEKQMETPLHHLKPGTVLNNKILINHALGEGGFGITYLAQDLNLDIKVAVKEYYPNGYVNRSNTVSPNVTCSMSFEGKDFFSKGKERFLKEARILAKFSKEPGIVEVRDFFEENNTVYIVMEYLEGEDLKEYLKRNGLLSPEEAIYMLMPIMKTLNKIHKQGLIHRDISPDNIRLSSDGVKLIDFGAARDMTSVAKKSLSVMLKPGYAPEEQYRSKGVQGSWTDVYALCATIYKCITGITPEDATQRLFKDELKTPTELGILMNKSLEYALMKGMAVLQKDRYQSIEELIEGFQNIHIPENVGDKTIDLGLDRTTREEKTIYIGKDNDNEKIFSTTKMESKITENLKKKIILKIVAVILVLFVGVAIISNSSDEKELENLPVDKFADSYMQNNTLNNNETSDNQIEMSEELFDFVIELEGIVYQLPCGYEDLSKNGWSISYGSDGDSTLISGNSHFYYAMVKENKQIWVTSYNTSGNAMKIKDCMVGGIEWDNTNVQAKLGKQITASSSVEEIEEAFGTPSERSIYDNMEILTYRVNDSYYNEVRFQCYMDEAEKEYSMISVTNFIFAENDKTETIEQRPAYLESYVAPESLGDNLVSGIISIEGDLYQFPTPVSAFIDNGWKIVQQPGAVVAGGSESICLERNNVRLDISVTNFADYQTTVENCAVCYIYIIESENIDIILPTGVSFMSLKEDVESVITDEFSYDKFEDCYNYSYLEYEGREISLSIDIDIETKKVSKISMHCENWVY